MGDGRLKEDQAFQQEAADVPYDNSGSGLAATDTQAAVDEVAAAIDASIGAYKEVFPLSPAADATTILSKAADHNGAADDQPKSPCTLQAKLTGGGGTEDITVVIDGLNAAGTVIQETLHPIFSALTKNGVKGFAKITNIAASGTWGGATLTLKNRAILGLAERPIASVFKEVFNGLDQTVGTFDATNLTYTPTGAIDGLKPLEVYYKKL